MLSFTLPNGADSLEEPILPEDAGADTEVPDPELPAPLQELLPELPEGSELPVSEAGASVATLVAVVLSAGADSGVALAVSAVAGLVVPPLP